MILTILSLAVVWTILCLSILTYNTKEKYTETLYYMKDMYGFINNKSYTYLETFKSMFTDNEIGRVIQMYQLLTKYRSSMSIYLILHKIDPINFNALTLNEINDYLSNPVKYNEYIYSIMAERYLKTPCGTLSLEHEISFNAVATYITKLKLNPNACERELYKYYVAFCLNESDPKINALIGSI